MEKPYFQEVDDPVLVLASLAREAGVTYAELMLLIAERAGEDLDTAEHDQVDRVRRAGR